MLFLRSTTQKNNSGHMSLIKKEVRRNNYGTAIRLLSYTVLLLRGLRGSWGQYELFTDRNTRDHLAFTIGDGYPMHEACIPLYTGYLAHENSKEEARGRSRHQGNSKRVVRNMDDRNVGTKGESPKQGLTSAEDPINIKFTESRNCTLPHYQTHTRI